MITWSDRFIELLLTSPSPPPTGLPPDLSLLVLLCEWMDGCGEVVEMLFGRHSLLQHMITLASTHHNDYVRGLATYAFLLCIHMGGGSEGGFLSAESLLRLIQHSLTLDVFKQSIQTLHASPAFTTLRSASQADTDPYHRYTQRRVRRGGELGEHVFVLEGGEVKDEVEESDVWVLEKGFVTRFDRVVEGMNDRLLGLLTSALSTGGGGVGGADVKRLQMENSQLRAENEALRQQVQRAGGGRQREGDVAQVQQLHSTIAQQKAEIDGLSQQLQELLQHRPAGGSGSGNESSAPATSLQRKYDELYAEHEDLLILLAQYAQAEEEAAKSQGVVPQAEAISYKQREEEKVGSLPMASTGGVGVHEVNGVNGNGFQSTSASHRQAYAAKGF